MNEFKGTPGVWDVDVNGHTILSDAGYKVADIVLIHGSDSDVTIMTAAPELLKSLTDCNIMNLPELLDWVADRMVYVYGENENIDFVLTLRHRASVCRAAIAKALGETK